MKTVKCSILALSCLAFFTPVMLIADTRGEIEELSESSSTLKARASYTVRSTEVRAVSGTGTGTSTVLGMCYRMNSRRDLEAYAKTPLIGNPHGPASHNLSYYSVVRRLAMLSSCSMAQNFVADNLDALEPDFLGAFGQELINQFDSAESNPNCTTPDTLVFARYQVPVTNYGAYTETQLKADIFKSNDPANAIRIVVDASGTQSKQVMSQEQCRNSIGAGSSTSIGTLEPTHISTFEGSVDKIDTQVDSTEIRGINF